MPALKTQEQKSESIKSQQIHTAKRGIVQRILRLDVCGWKPKEIAKEVSLSGTRLSIIMHSPRYLEERARLLKEVDTAVVQKESTMAVEGDYVKQKLKTLAKDAIDVKGELLYAENEGVRNAAASDVLDRAGYGAKKETRATTITMSEKIAERIEKVMGYDEFAEHERARQITITEEVST